MTRSLGGAAGSRAGPAILLAVLAATGSPSSGLATSSGTAVASQLRVQVLYQKRACKNAPARPARVSAGTLVLDRKGNGNPVRVSLLDQPSATVRIRGVGPVSAKLILRTPRVEVVDGQSSSAAIQLALGKDAPSGGRLQFSVGRDEDDNAHVNTLIVLQRAARVAAETSPRQLQQLTARVSTGAGPAFDKPNVMHTGDAEWEPTPLTHEYGHFVLAELAPDGFRGGDHHVARSYRAQPFLAWSEGFPAAFAALVLAEGNGSLFVECGKPYQNLAASPASPDLLSASDRRFAQHNETRVGAAAYQLVQRFGGAQVGLKKLLTALTQYRRAGHPVWQARDLRDLAAGHLARTKDEHAAINKIFGGQRISWARQFGVALDFAAFAQSGTVLALPEIAIAITGPGGFDCRARGGDITPASPGAQSFKLDDGTPVFGVKSADGGLSASANDDCYLISGDGSPNPIGEPPAIVGSATLPLPYLSNLAHWTSDFQLRALYSCQTAPPIPSQPPPSCPVSAPVDLTVVGGNEDPAYPRQYKITVPIGVETTLVRFWADGECEVLGGSGDTDCSA